LNCGIRVQRKPSEDRSQFYIPAVCWESYLADLISGWPNPNIIIGSDFDHGDAVATWPQTEDVIKKMPTLTDEDREKVLGGNAMRLLGLNGNGTAVKMQN